VEKQAADFNGSLEGRGSRSAYGWTAGGQLGRPVHRVFPRSRGWTGRARGRRLPAKVFPALAGLNRRRRRIGIKTRPCSPRLRGWTEHRLDL